MLFKIIKGAETAKKQVCNLEIENNDNGVTYLLFFYS